jgi:ribosome-binding protein aMBF1 (putative translation factor)
MLVIWRNMEEKPSGVMPQTSTLSSSEIRVDVGNFSKLLGALKRVRKWSNADLCRELKVAKSSMSSWANGKSEPRPDRRKELEALIRNLLSESESEQEQEPAPPPETPTSYPGDSVEPPADRPKLRSLKPGDRRWEI